MTILYMSGVPSDRFDEWQLPDGSYRYEGYRSSIRYCVDSTTRKTKQDIYAYLDRHSVDFLIDREGFILHME